MGVLLFLGILLPVVRSQTKDDSKPPQQAPEFYDDPKFTVSDVADPTSLGGHGSNATAATRQSLAEDVQAIKGQSTSAPTNKRDLENALQRDPVNAHLHHQLAELEEHSGNAIAAVKQFQRAAELDPSEQNLLDWGSELVAHGAAEPAGEVFTKGHRLFPRSVRMLVAMGTAWYLRGSYEQAINSLCDASDLEPNNATPHLFLGKILVAENVSGERVRNTLKRIPG
jgi:Tfp pilus assembly protein PilF